MASRKKRGPYGPSNSEKPSDPEIANDIVTCLKKDIAQSIFDGTGFAATVKALVKAKPSIQRLVLNALKPAPISNRSQRKIPDKAVLDCIENHTSELSRNSGKKVTVKFAAIYCLENGHLRLGRLDKVPFRAKSTAGQKEINRVIAAVVRARSTTKSKYPPIKRT